MVIPRQVDAAAQDGVEREELLRRSCAENSWFDIPWHLLGHQRLSIPVPGLRKERLSLEGGIDSLKILSITVIELGGLITGG